jgi:hypothetical protein
MRRAKIRSPAGVLSESRRVVRSTYPLISNSGIGTAINYVHLGVPQIYLGLVILGGLLSLMLNLGQTFLLLVSRTRVLVRCFATDQEHTDRDKGNELKVFHI